jgi:hypothetical protein
MKAVNTRMSSFNLVGIRVLGKNAQTSTDSIRYPSKPRKRLTTGVRLVAFLAIGAHCSSLHAADYTFNYCGLDVKYTSVEKISITYLGWLAPPVTFSGSVGAIVYWPFDTENQPLHNGWTAVGLVTFGSGDIDSESVGGVLWTKGNGLLKPTESPEASKLREASVTFDVSVNGKSCDKHLMMRISNNGPIFIGRHLLSTINQ